MIVVDPNPWKILMVEDGFSWITKLSRRVTTTVTSQVTTNSKMSFLKKYDLGF
jgi:hypothetical protein